MQKVTGSTPVISTKGSEKSGPFFYTDLLNPWLERPADLREGHPERFRDNLHQRF